jgi:hypothetical protein
MIYPIGRPLLGNANRREGMAEEEHDEEFTPEEKINMESALAEIKLADPVLFTLLSWVAHNDEYDEEDFAHVLGVVYSFARSTNPSMEKMEGEQDGE